MIPYTDLHSECHDFNEKVRLVILGEASTLSTFFLNNNQRLTKANYLKLSKLSSLIIEDEEEIVSNEEYLVVDPLIKSLILLKSRLSKERIASLEPAYFKPFCDVIVNKDVSGPITGLSLQSILKFLNYGFIKDGPVVQLIGESVTKVRFVGTDPKSDETVLMRILSVLETLIVQPFYSLSNGVVCEIMQSCFRIAFESRLSELLRNCAVKSLTEMVRALFGRIAFLDKDASDFNYFYQDKSNASKHKLNRMGRRFVGHSKQQHGSEPVKINKEDVTYSDTVRENHGLACLHELLGYLTSLINPLPDGQNSEDMINVGLDLLIVIFETAVTDIGGKHFLMSVVKTDLCWNIMQLLQNDKNINSFVSVLRLAFLIFVNLRMHLKYQFESLLLRLMDIINIVNAPLEYRDICIEYILLFFRYIPYLPHELFFNFDCDPYSANLLEDLLQLMSKNCFANSSNQNLPQSVSLNFTTLQMLSFEVLLANLKSLQKSELCKENYLLANPATVIVNISNFKDDFSGKHTGSNYNICNSVKEFSQPSEPVETIGEESSQPVEPEIDQQPPPSPQQVSVAPAEVVPVVQPDSELPAPTINKYGVTLISPDNSDLVHSTEEIICLKQRKVSLWTATEKFNQKPSKGIEFLYENGLVNCEDDVVHFLRNNSRLDKKQMGEYLSNKKNMEILSKFVQSFVFKEIRIDEALRLYLESFRLPGEAPLISLVLEQFAHHWHESNHCPFENEDAAFSLAYAIIMLNVDQHNSNVKRQTIPMTCNEFISNLRQVNGGKDFDRNMLGDIYSNIQSNEIIMPAEQQGVVREKYLWKCLLKNSETRNAIYWFNEIRSPTMGEYSPFVERKENRDFTVRLNIINKSIFDISWGPSISTLTLVFDKVNPDRQPTLSRRVLNYGFTSYSLLCANYGHLDNLIDNLSKFVITSSKVTNKSQLVAHCLFGITKEYANEMRTSWTNIIELILYWYDNKLLDGGFEIEDFALESKKINFHRNKQVKNAKQMNESANQSTFLSSFYSYFASNSINDELEDSANQNLERKISNGTSSESNANSALNCNEYCQALLLIIEESKFLHIDSLIELIRALINVQLSDDFDDDIEIFKLEIVVKIILMNRDRLSIFWDHIYKFLLKLMKYCPQREYLTERIISTIFRLAIRFTSRPDSLNDQIFLLIYQMLLTFEPHMLQRKITAQALHSFVSHCNSFFAKPNEWILIFNFILAVAIGYYPSSRRVQEDGRGYTSDSEVILANSPKAHFSTSVSSNELNKLSTNLSFTKNISEEVFTINYSYRIYDVEAYEKCADIMVLIIREYLPNHSKTIQFKNDADDGGDSSLALNRFEIPQMAVSVLCKFVEASIKIQMNPNRSPKDSLFVSSNEQQRLNNNKSRFTRITNVILSSSESESEDEPHEEHHSFHTKISPVTENVALKLLDLMHYFHLNAPLTVGEPANSEILWNSIWCPLLQAISFFCCDCRRPVRTYAFTFLQRTLLLHDLKALNAAQWESCFNKVLFPLLSKLLEPINMCDPIGMDETRMRTTNLLCKVFLQHLNPLLTLNTFTALWLTILDFMEKYIKADLQTDLVKEAIPESLKNILLVMKTAGCFHNTLAAITWDRINTFLPNLYQELMIPHESQPETEPMNQTVLNSVEQSECYREEVTNTAQYNNYATPSGDEPQEKPVYQVNAEEQYLEAANSVEPTDPATNNETIPVTPVFNLPSTYIDLESVVIHSEPSPPPPPPQPKPVPLFSQLPVNVYPGSIAQYIPDGNVPIGSGHYFHSPVTTTSESNSSQSYPWPMPNLADSSSSSTFNNK